MKKLLYSSLGNSLLKGMMPGLLFFLFISLSNGLKAQVYSANFNSNIQSWVNGSSNSWSRVSTGGVSNSGCLTSTIVCEQGQQQGSCINENNYFIATPSVSLTGGNTYQISIKCSVATASTRKLVLGVNSSQARSGATTIQNFGYVATGSYNTFTINYTPTSTGSPYFVLWGEKFTTQSVGLWLDDFAVTLVNSAPTISLSSPANNSVYNEGASAFTFQASVSDAESNLSKVEFYSNGTKVGEKTSSPYSISYIPTVGGSYSLTAKATDSYGANTTSAARTISFRTMPIIEFVTPDLEFPTYAEGPLSLTVNATDADGTVSYVDFYVDGDLVYTDMASPWSYSWTATAGTHEFNAVATDNHGLQSDQNVFPAGFGIEANTCSLSAPTSSSTTICEGASLTFTSGYSSLLTGTIQWQRQPSGGSWANISGATNASYSATLAGNYRGIWTFENGATCTTAVDTIHFWNPSPNFQFDSVGCAGLLTNLSVVPMTNPVNGQNVLYSYQWTITPSAAYSNLPSGSQNVWQGKFFRSSESGNQEVVLQVTNSILGCSKSFTQNVAVGSLAGLVSNNTLQSGLNTSFTAYALGINGAAPYQFEWTNKDTCLTPNCDSIKIANTLDYTLVTITDTLGCAFSDTAEGGFYGKRMIIPAGPTVACSGSNLLCNAGFGTTLVSTSGGGSGPSSLQNAEYWTGIADYYRPNGITNYNLSINGTCINELGVFNNSDPNSTGINDGLVGGDPMHTNISQKLISGTKSNKKYFLVFDVRASKNSEFIPTTVPFTITGYTSGNLVASTYNFEVNISYSGILNNWIPSSGKVISVPYLPGSYLGFALSQNPHPLSLQNGFWYKPSNPNLYFGNKYLYYDNFYFAQFPELECEHLFTGSSGSQINWSTDASGLAELVNRSGATFSWSPSSGLSATNIANPVANPTTQTTYTCTMTIAGVGYNIGSVTVHPDHIWDLGTNPSNPCPIVLETGTPCTEDFNSVGGQDVTYEITIEKEGTGQNAWRELRVSSGLTIFATTVNIRYLDEFTNTYLDVNESPSTSLLGQHYLISSSQVEGYKFSSTKAYFRILVDASSPQSGGAFKTLAYTKVPNQTSESACRRNVLDSMPDLEILTMPSPDDQNGKFKRQWGFFPNPGNGTIALNGVSKGDKVLVFDALGKLQFELNLLDKDQMVNFSSLARGYYQLVVISDGVHLGTKPLVIVK
jgi:hypothetical protein